MTVVRYFFPQDIIFARVQKLLKKQGFVLTEIDQQNGVIAGRKGLLVIGPQINVELMVEFQGETLTSVSVDLNKGKTWFNLSDKKLKQFENRLVEKMYSQVI